VAVRNLRNAALPMTGTEFAEETGRTTVAGAAIELALVRISPTLHALTLRATGEYRRFEGIARDPGDPETTRRLDEIGYRVGGEIVLGSFMSTRVGYIEDPLRELSDLTFGAGVEFLVPLIRVNVRGDYARVPTRSLLRPAEAASFSSDERHERYAATAWIDF
jgi:hypothetical protein